MSPPRRMTRLQRLDNQSKWPCERQRYAGLRAAAMAFPSHVFVSLLAMGGLRGSMKSGHLECKHGLFEHQARAQRVRTHLCTNRPSLEGHHYFAVSRKMCLVPHANAIAASSSSPPPARAKQAPEVRLGRRTKCKLRACTSVAPSGIASGHRARVGCPPFLRKKWQSKSSDRYRSLSAQP